MQLLVEAQKAQIETAEQMLEAGTAALDPEKFGAARQQLEDAGKQAIKAAEAWNQAQWQWLNMWRC